MTAPLETETETEAEEQQFQLINKTDDLPGVVAALAGHDAIAVDLEADSMFHFTERVCLIQVGTASHCFLIDPLTVTDLSPLKPLFADHSIKKIFHGADYDVRCLHRDFGIVINNLYDCEIACKFLGIRSTGLDAVISAFFDVHLDKKFQKKDWSQRPLPGEMCCYAAQDVQYLIPLCHRLETAVAEKGRTGWVAEECRDLAGVRHADPNGRALFMRFKGAGRLDRRTLAALESLLHTRLAIAEEKDRPPFKVLNNSVLLKLAQERPKTLSVLKQSGILTKRQFGMCAEQLLTAINAAVAMPEKELPVYPKKKRKSLPLRASRRVKALKQWRDKTADRLDLDPGVFLPNALVVAIVSANPGQESDLDTVPNLKTWRKENFGKEIVQVINTTK
ncbi:MAG: HRDC domain-containing protein [Thermodesulfobacteriota bacterium]|nr:HRDC domain-containing protein [Thermodesulfobacteriota bacterium]